MKKILFSLLILITATSANAQNDALEKVRHHSPEKIQEFNFGHSDKLKRSSDWFNFARELANISSSMPYYRNSLFPDSTVQTEFSNGMGYVWMHSLGQVLDPTSSFYIFDSKPISKSANYTLDSIAIPYRYNRVQFGAPDTLLIQVFAQSAMTFNPAPSWSTPRSYARVSYDYLIEEGVAPIKEIVVLLDENDSTTASQRIILEEVDIDVLLGEKIAIAYFYKPGNPYSVDDTIDFNMVPLPGNQINGLLVYTYRDESSTLDNDYYNHSIWANTGIRYNINANGWNGTYLPGTAYGNNGGNYQTDVFFKITFDDFTGISNEVAGFSLEVYPNPAIDEVNISFELNNSENAVLEFTDMLGNRIYQQNLAINSERETINISHWKNGIYFYSLKVDGNILGTARLVVAR